MKVPSFPDRGDVFVLENEKHRRCLQWQRQASEIGMNNKIQQQQQQQQQEG